MVLYPSKLILLLSSYIKSSVKLRGPVPEAAMHVHAMTPPPPCFTDEAVCLGSFAVPFFSPHFLLSHHLDKGSSLSHCLPLSHRSINTVPKLFWLTFVLFFQTLILPFYFLCWSEVCILLCNICNSVSKSPEDSRLSEHNPSFLEVVGDFTDTSFRVQFHSFYYLSVINYCCFLSQSGSCWLFPNSWFLHALCFVAL